MTSHNLRPARKSDLPEILVVLTQAYRDHLAALQGLPDVTALSDTEFAEHRAWVVDDNGRLLGVALARFDPPVAHLGNIAVRPDAAGRGIARRLVDAVISAARDAGCTRLDLATHPDMGSNVAMYRHMGWQVTDHTPQKVRMTRAL